MAYAYLYNKIVSHELEPGSAIVEQEISNSLGISRTPVREALKQLGAEGLVRIIPARGAFVSEITSQDVEEIFSLREMLEVWALKVSLERMPEEEIDRVGNLLSSLNENSSNDEFYSIDRILHDLIVRYCGNRRLVAFLNTLNAQIERIRQISALLPHRLEKSKREHLAIIAAIKERDSEKACALLSEHIRNVKNSCLEELKITQANRLLNEY